MNFDEVLQSQNLLIIFLSLTVHSADDAGDVTKDSGVHQSTNEHDDD